MARKKEQQSRKEVYDLYLADLHATLDQLFTYAAEVLQFTWRQLAKEADLSYVTVKRLGERQTRFPRWQTVWKIARACGISMTLVHAQSKKPLPKNVKQIRLKIAR